MKSNDKGLANLPCTIHDKHFIAVRLRVILYLIDI